MKVWVCAEIIYEDRENGLVHSDICMTHGGEYFPTDEYRAFLHRALDEWLDKSEGTGMFWVGDPEFASANFNKEEDSE